MDIGVYSIEEITNNEISKKIKKHESFVLNEIEVMSFGKTVETVEELIESTGLKCRIYTKGRAAAIGAAAIPVSPTVIGGWLSGIVIGIHNIATWDPDYEVAKNMATGSLTITYKK